jgi:hypothetical protein
MIYPDDGPLLTNLENPEGLVVLVTYGDLQGNQLLVNQGKELILTMAMAAI